MRNINERSTKNKGTVLDYGCADGNNSLFLLERGFNVCCIDITKESIDTFLNKKLSKPII